MSDSQTPTDTTQQATSQTPATKQKNPKRVAAGKAIAEKTRIAREAQKKLSSRRRVSLQIIRPKFHQCLTLHRLWMNRPKTFSRQHNG